MDRKAKAAARKAMTARIAQAHAETLAVVKTGVCPDCGSKLRRNLSMTGWWQCVQYGAVGFRADSLKPSCGWQGFTE